MKSESDLQNSATSTISLYWKITTILFLLLLICLFFWRSTGKIHFVFFGLCLLLFHQGVYIYGMLSSRTNLFIKTIKGRDLFRENPGYLLRFDDGPHPDYTPQILELLKKYKQKAIFFLTGHQAEKYPQLVRQIIRENHRIGNHTYSHPYNFVFLSKKTIRLEIEKTNRIIKNITGMTPVYFGPPMGHKVPRLASVLKQLNLTAMMWDINSKDTVLTKNNILKRIQKQSIRNKIILFHDGIYPWTKQTRNDTLLALKQFLVNSKDMNFKVRR